jgi:predicted aldo/keto reductase-like oxidoreductase
MMEADTYRNQSLRGQLVTILEAAKALGLYVFSSSSIGMGGIDRSLIERELIRHLPDLNHASAALQFTRSTPGLGTALVGMKRKEHLEDALRISITPPLPQALFDEMLSAV